MYSVFTRSHRQCEVTIRSLSVISGYEFSACTVSCAISSGTLVSECFNNVSLTTTIPEPFNMDIASLIQGLVHAFDVCHFHSCVTGTIGWEEMPGINGHT